MIGLGSDKKQPYNASQRTEVFVYTCFLKLTMQKEEELASEHPSIKEELKDE